MRALTSILVAAGLSISGCGGAAVSGKPFATINRASLQREDPVWKRAYQEVLRDGSDDDSEVPLAVLKRGDPTEKVVALTFDDGPHGAKTLKLLNLLRQEGVKATFFVVGKMAKKYPAIVRQMAREGHEVANHTYSHATLTRVSPLEARADYDAASDVLQSITGRRPALCRPPGGDLDPAVIEAAKSLGMTTVLWTNDPGDYYRPGESVILERALAKTSNGGIILLHDGIDQMLNVLPVFIQTLRAEGYRIVTAGELARERLHWVNAGHPAGRT